MHSGGSFPFIGNSYNPPSDYHYWYSTGVQPSGYMWTDTWSKAYPLYQFLWWYHSPGGTLIGTRAGNDMSQYDGLSAGDLIFYDWGKGEGISHAGMQVGTGYDPNNHLYGDYTDQHSTGSGNPYGYRYHAFWSLSPYNLDRNTTTIYLIHVSPNN